MSYILDALKRAERERRAGSQSLLDELPGPAPAPAAAPWRRWVLVVAATALVSALLVYVLLARNGHPAALPSPAPTVVVAPLGPPVAAAPAPAAVTRPVLEAPAEGTAPALEDDGHMSSLDDLQAEDAAPKKPARVPEGNPATAPAAPPSESHASRSRPGEAAAAMEAPPAPVLAGTAPSEDAAADGTLTTTPEGTDAGATDAALPPTATSPARGPRIKDEAPLQEMSEAYRASFPDITVDVHSYSDAPDQRFVLIGGKRYREGDRVPPGAIIVGIVPEGIVFDWNGQRVLYSLAR